MNNAWVRWWNKAARPKSATPRLRVESLEARENPAVITAITMPAGILETNTAIPIGGTFQLTNQDANVAHEYELRVVRNNQLVTRVVGTVPGGATGTVPTLNFTPTVGGQYSTILVFSEPGRTSDYSDNTNLVPVSRGFVVEPTIPVARILSGPTTSTEGSPVTFSGRFDDAGGTYGGPYLYTWQATSTNGDRVAFGDRNSVPGDVRSFTFTPRDDGPYTISLEVRDSQGHASQLVTQQLRVTPVAPLPVINANVGANPQAGQEVRAIGEFTDPAGVQDRPYTITWTLNSTTGQTDSRTQVVQSSADLTGAPFRFTPQQAGTYTLTLAVADKDRATGTVVRTFTIGAAPASRSPELQIRTPTTPATEAQSLTIGGRFTDPDGAGDSPWIGSWTVAGPGGYSTTTPLFSAAQGDVADLVFTPPATGNYTITLALRDAHGASQTQSTVVFVANSLPTIELAGPVTPVVEGGTVNVTAIVADAGGRSGGPYRYTWRVETASGVRVPEQTGTAATPGEIPGFSFAATDSGTFKITLAVQDQAGGYSSQDITVTVGNVAPTGRLVLRTANPLINQPVRLEVVDVVDPGQLDVAQGLSFSFDVDGDGQFNGPNDYQNYNLTSIQAYYTRPGTYSPRVRIADRDGNYTESTISFVVVDPNAGTPTNLPVTPTNPPVDNTPPATVDQPPATSPIVTARGSLLAVAAEAGGGPRVVVYNADTREVKYDFFAFDPSYTGGVSVALGDITGDGMADIVVAARSNGVPVVRVFDGQTFREIASFFAYDPAYRGGVTVAVGDLNGDGLGEIILGTTHGGGSHVRAVDAKKLGDLNFDGTLKASALVANYMAFSAGSVEGISVAAGDLDRDGMGEIVVGAAESGRSIVKVYNGTGTRATHEFLAYSPEFYGGVSVAVGDVDGDGFDDLITGSGAKGGAHVKVIDGTRLNELTAAGMISDAAVKKSFLAFGNDYRGGVSVGVAESNKAGEAGTLTVGSGPLAPPAVAFVDGKTLAKLKSFDPFTGFFGGLDVG